MTERTNLYAHSWNLRAPAQKALATETFPTMSSRATSQRPLTSYVLNGCLAGPLSLTGAGVIVTLVSQRSRQWNILLLVFHMMAVSVNVTLVTPAVHDDSQSSAFLPAASVTWNILLRQSSGAVWKSRGPSLIVRTVSVDVKQQWTWTFSDIRTSNRSTEVRVLMWLVSKMPYWCFIQWCLADDSQRR